MYLSLDGLVYMYLHGKEQGQVYWSGVADTVDQSFLLLGGIGVIFWGRLDCVPL
jgi:hypothetical protein